MKNKEKTISVIAGGAGFIGVNLGRELLKNNRQIIVADNFSLGSKENIKKYLGQSFTDILSVDLSKISGVSRLFNYCKDHYGQVNEIWHLAANSDIPSGINDSNVDLRDTFLTTFNLLEGAKFNDVKKFNFASSSAVYGDWLGKPLSETLGPLKPISNYGAMKLASEAQICAAAESFLAEANIFRFPNVVGVPATHGVILDFINQLKKCPEQLEVLGNGKQRKSYLHVSELVSAMIFLSDKANRNRLVEVVNIGCDDDGILISDIAKVVKKAMAPAASILFGNEDRGWLGDVPKFSYNIDYLRSLGWSPELSSRDAVRLATREILEEISK